MKSDYFISVFVAVALCFGQLASNAHVLSHLDTQTPAATHSHQQYASEQPNNRQPNNRQLTAHLGGHSESGHKHDARRDLHVDHALGAHFADIHATHEHGTDTDSEFIDCFIYHLYAGSNYLTTTQSSDACTGFKCVNSAIFLSLRSPAGTAHRPHIRGPPTLS